MLRRQMVAQHSDMMREELLLDVVACIRHLEELQGSLVGALHRLGHVYGLVPRLRRDVDHRGLHALRRVAHLLFEGDALLQVDHALFKLRLLAPELADLLQRKGIVSLCFQERVGDEKVV